MSQTNITRYNDPPLSRSSIRNSTRRSGGGGIKISDSRASIRSNASNNADRRDDDTSSTVSRPTSFTRQDSTRSSIRIADRRSSRRSTPGGGLQVVDKRNSESAFNTPSPTGPPNVAAPSPHRVIDLSPQQSSPFATNGSRWGEDGSTMRRSISITRPQQQAPSGQQEAARMRSSVRIERSRGSSTEVDIRRNDFTPPTYKGPNDDSYITSSDRHLGDIRSAQLSMASPTPASTMYGNDPYSRSSYDKSTFEPTRPTDYGDAQAYQQQTAGGGASGDPFARASNTSPVQMRERAPSRGSINYERPSSRASSVRSSLVVKDKRASVNNGSVFNDTSQGQVQRTFSRESVNRPSSRSSYAEPRQSISKTPSVPVAAPHDPYASYQNPAEVDSDDSSQSDDNGFNGQDSGFVSNPAYGGDSSFGGGQKNNLYGSENVKTDAYNGFGDPRKSYAASELSIGSNRRMSGSVHEEDLKYENDGLRAMLKDANEMIAHLRKKNLEMEKTVKEKASNFDEVSRSLCKLHVRLLEDGHMKYLENR